MKYSVGRHNIAKYGLGADFVGALLVGLSGHFGHGAGFGGYIVWLSPHWRVLWLIGWGLLALGFLLQFTAIKRSKQLTSNKQEKHPDAKPTNRQQLLFGLLILLFLLFGSVTCYFKYVNSNSLLELLPELSIYAGLLSIILAYWLSQTTIIRIDKSLYPNDFEVQVVGTDPIKSSPDVAYPGSNGVRS